MKFALNLDAQEVGCEKDRRSRIQGYAEVSHALAREATFPSYLNIEHKIHEVDGL